MDGSVEPPGESGVTTTKKKRRGKAKFTHYKMGSRGGKPRRSTSTEKIRDEANVTLEVNLSDAQPDSLPGVAVTSDQQIAPTADSSGLDMLGSNSEDARPDAFHALHSSDAGPSGQESALTAEIIGLEDNTGDFKDNNVTPVTPAIAKPDADLISAAVTKLKQHITLPWHFVTEEDGINVLLLSKDRERSCQRRVYFSFNGDVEISVHRKTVKGECLTNILRNNRSAVVLQPETCDLFVQRIVNVVKTFRTFDICVGVDDKQVESLWSIDSGGVVDNNPYGETRYSVTFRPYKCDLVVATSRYTKRRCSVCYQTKNRFRTKITHHQSESVAPHTANVYLDKTQMLHKLGRVQKDLKHARIQIARLKVALQNAIARDGVSISNDLSNDLLQILDNSKLTPCQALFIEEQIKACQAKSPSGRRWHPTIIRFALLLKSTSSAAYEAVRDSGVIILPSERTLYEYSHAIKAETGCTTNKLNRVCKILSEKYYETYQKYFVLALDEVHICSKLVYKKSTGEMVGYVDLNDAEQELIKLETELKGEKGVDTVPVATKMLTFQVNGVACNVCEVVASFPTTDDFDSESLYDRVWEVIGACERSGIKIVAVVGDGAAVNRAFFNSNTPFSTADVVFDTINLCDPTRLIYFFSDVPHLLKTIRNCFCKSGSGPGCTRLLTKNNQVIVWETIRKLYKEDKDNNLRRCHKLNSNNVFLNSFSRMKVNYASQVMSNSVASDLESRNWPGTSETVKFIRAVNDFFDMLNGVSTIHGLKTANSNLDPYEDNEQLEERFKKLMMFLDYLKEWKAEVDAKPGFTAAEKRKMILSQQTLEGIEITIRSFIGVTRFLLKETGFKFINARVFCQDRLERYFGKQRQSGGGSRNPTVAQFTSNEVKIGVHRDLNVRKGNVTKEVKGFELTEEPLAKRTRK